MKTIRINKIQFLKILESGDFSKIIGIEESEEVEFKQSAYKFTNFKDKFEFVKDITGISNSNGGIICIGVKEEKSENKVSSYAKEIVKFDKNFDVTQWKDVLIQRVHPTIPLSSIRFNYYRDKKEENELFIINIPKANRKNFPYLINSAPVLDENGIAVYQNGVCCYSRNETQIMPLVTPETIQGFISRGMNKRDIPDYNKPVSPIQKIREIRSKTSDITSDFEFAKKNIDSKSFMYIYAKPNRNLSIEKFWDKSKNSVYDLINEPPSIRKGGWDLNTSFSDNPSPGNDKWISKNGERKLLTISRNLEVFVAGDFDSFLDWGIKNQDSGVKILNNFAITEYITNICLLLADISKKFKLTYKEVEVGFELGLNKSIYLFRPHEVGWYRNEKIGPNVINKTRVSFSESRNYLKMAGKIMLELYNSIFSSSEPFAYIIQIENDWLVEEDRYKKLNI